MWWALLRLLTGGAAAEGLSEHLRLGVSGGAPLPVEILRGVKEHLGISIMEGYGLSETSPVASFSRRERPRPGSIGLPVWGVEMDLIDPADAEWARVGEVDEIGEIIVRGHNVMTGYLGRPEETAAVLRDGWFRTGDLGRRDAEGFYWVVDRSKDMIVRAGYNVYPREVEEVLLTHEQISLAAVVGVPHESLGEEVIAHLILVDGATATAEELKAWAKEQMADYKYPREIVLAESLPMTSTGKILKRELR